MTGKNLRCGKKARCDGKKTKKIKISQKSIIHALNLDYGNRRREESKVWRKNQGVTEKTQNFKFSQKSIIQALNLEYGNMRPEKLISDGKNSNFKISQN